MAEIKKLTHDEVAYFCEQTLLVINAGIPLADGMEILSEDIEDKNVKKVAVFIAKKLLDGETLFDAMEETKVFPVYAVNMVRVGMISGRIEDVLRGLTSYYESRSELMQSLRSAVLHPILLITMMTAVIIVLIVQVIPMFNEIFGRFDSSVAQTLDSSISYAYSIGFTVLVIMLVVIVISVIIALLTRIEPVRKALAGFASKFVLTKRISSVFAEAKFTEAMSMMISSGIDPVESLDNAAELTDDKRLLARIENCRSRMLEGASFGDAICDAKLLRPVYARSIKIAYKSGSFEDTWKKISARCSDEAEAAAANIVAFIEPVLVGMLVAVIGAVMLTIMLPMMNIISVLG